MTISGFKTGRERASRAAGRYRRPVAGAAREQSQPTASPRAAEGAVGAEGLADFSGRVPDSGEGRWTVLAAVDNGVPASVIAASVYEGFESRDNGLFTAKVLSALRSEFGGHAEKEA
jgi:hypothetical protein